MKKQNRKQIVLSTIKEGKKLGASHISVYSTNKNYFYTSYKNGDLQDIQESTTNHYQIRLFCNNRFASVSTKDLRKESISDFLKQNIAMVK